MLAGWVHSPGWVASTDGDSVGGRQGQGPGTGQARVGGDRGPQGDRTSTEDDGSMGRREASHSGGRGDESVGRLPPE